MQAGGPRLEAVTPESLARWAHRPRPLLQDLPRTFPANAWVQSEEGQGALRRVLCAFAQHKRDVGYCQGLNYIAAMLLLAMHRDEEKAFWLLASLIDDSSEGGRAGQGGW